MADRADRVSSQALDVGRTAGERSGQALAEAEALRKRVQQLEDAGAGSAGGERQSEEGASAVARQLRELRVRMAGIEASGAAVGQALAEVGGQAARMAGVPETQVNEAAREWKQFLQLAKNERTPEGG